MDNMMGATFWMQDPDYGRMKTTVVQIRETEFVVRNEFGVRKTFPRGILGLKEREKSPEAQAADAAALRKILSEGKNAI